MLKIRGKPITLARVVRSLRGRWTDRVFPTTGFRGVHASFAEAEQSAPPVKSLGYDAADAGGWYPAKRTGIQLEDYPVTYWLRDAFKDGSTVFEIGGHVGIAFYGFTQVMEYPAGLQWTICDVPTVAAAGEALARERGEPRLRFVTKPSDVPGADIVIAAGALQYIESPTLGETLAAMRHRPKHVLVNVTPVYDGPSFVTLQNLGNVYCPYRVFNRSEFVASLDAAGYGLIDSWQKPRRFEIPGHPDRSFDHYSGFYFRAR